MTSPENLFHQMNQALRTGQFDQLADFQAELEQITEKLSETDPLVLDRLRDLAQRSARLLLSARLGIRESQRMYQDIQNPNSRIVVYQANGRKQDLMIGGGTTIRG